MSTREIAGKTVEFDEEGFLVNPDDWSKDIAVALAKEIGIDELTEGHWQVIEFSRADFAEKGEAPTLRRITKAGGVPTKELYKLFPKGPAKKVALVSGLGKPTGCI
jgi:tRNA 2-thiouridine synthesizing protein E